ALAKLVDGLEGVQEVNFVAHSLGNLVIRHFLADRANSSDPRPRSWRLGRIVMLAPPNQGAEIAMQFRHNPIYQTVWGETGRELAEEWSSLSQKLAVPSCQFGIIAGGVGNSVGRNPLLSGDDDFVVCVEETRLVGARDFCVL